MQNKIIFILVLIIFGVIAGGFYLLTQQENVVYENIYSEEIESSNVTATGTVSTAENFTKETGQESE